MLQPAIILVESQLGENIGMCARAMLNCGLTDLRLVNPQVAWPHAGAKATASGADEVLDGAKVYATLDEALTDCQLVLATSSRSRGSEVPVWESAEAAAHTSAAGAVGQKVGLLFGPEASGLNNEAVSRADALLRFDTNPAFASLNLAQCVLLVSWEWKKACQSRDVGASAGSGGRFKALPDVAGDLADRAPRADTEIWLQRLEAALEERRFFLTPELKPHTLRALRHLVFRLRPSAKELKMLHGVLSALLKPRADERD